MSLRKEQFEKLCDTTYLLDKEKFSSEQWEKLADKICKVFQKIDKNLFYELDWYGLWHNVQNILRYDYGLDGTGDKLGSIIEECRK